MSSRLAFRNLARDTANLTPKITVVPRPLNLLYADKAIIAINKPSGLICQSDKSYVKYGRISAFDQLLEDVKAKLKLDDAPKQVHRLDKYTTGVYLLAKSDTHARALSLQFREHSLKKTYLAVVRGGRITFPEEGQGSVTAPLLVTGENVVVDERDGTPTLTDWELLGSSEVVPLSLLQLTLHSGVKHQLRVHLSQVMQAPVLGDTLYSSKAPPKRILDLVPKGVTVVSQQTLPPGRDWGTEKATRRLFLHAAHVDVTRYRSSGPSKRLSLGISAPIPWYFLKMCKSVKLDQYIPQEYIRGGLTVDGEPIALNSEIEGIEGRWLGPKINLDDVSQQNLLLRSSPSC